MYILVVDDEEVVRLTLERVLHRAGHRTCWASTGQGALRLMRTEKPDLVILDMMLGDMNGWEVADAKKRDCTIAAIPTVVLTGLDPAAVRLRGSPNESALSEILLVLSKPVDDKAIIKAIEHIGGLTALQQR
jgi:CheY-like chemotaxis protein